MIDEIIAGISLALNAEFGDDVKIYPEQQKQGFEGPCFFILSIQPSDDLFLGKRHFRRYPFVVHYFPASDLEPKQECYGVAERLYDCLEHITVQGSPSRGTQMKFTVEDGVLIFLVNYDMFVYKVEETTAMGELSNNITAKG